MRKQAKAVARAVPAYEVVGFEMLDPNDLTPHPAADIPIDDADVASIGRSIFEQGILHPLLVSEAANDDANRDIYDGVNRWKTALAQGLAEVPCLVVRCSNPAMIVAESLAAGRKRSTGQRILVFLEAHKQAVLEAREMGRKMQGNIQSQLRNRQQNAGVSHDTPGGLDYSPEAIATLLKCSRKDVVSALELFEALHTATVPECRSSGEPAHAADEAELAVLAERRNGVLCGSEPVRTWKKGLFGKIKNGGQGRADVDIFCTLKRSLLSLNNQLPKWRQLSHDEREGVEMLFGKMMSVLPDDLLLIAERRVRQ
jgi:hypothetical protein